jgi:hypothetical protein
MKDDIYALLDHYCTVSDGSSALWTETFGALCVKHGISADEFSYAFAREIAERFVTERIDFDSADFAMNDLFWASGCSLKDFALEVFNAFDEGEGIDPRFPPGTVPWRDYTLPAVRAALKSDDESRAASSAPDL